MKEYIIIALLIVVLMGVYVFNNSEPLGTFFTQQNAYSGAATYSSSTLSSGAAEVLSRATSSRSFARICNRTGENIIYLFKQATSTGVTVGGGGYPIMGTSTAGYDGYSNCMVLDVNDPYTGAVWGISTASTTVGVEAIQN